MSAGPAHHDCKRGEQDLRKNDILIRKLLLYAAAVCLLVTGTSGCSGRTEDFLKISGEKEEKAAEREQEDPEREKEIPESPAVYVYVCGAVVSPGVYELPEGSRICQAVDAAGGFLPEAVPEAVNLARVITDGEQLYIPSEEDLDEKASLPGMSASGDGLVDLNTATVDTLCTLPGICEAKARAVIAYREKNGPFASPEELMQVEGIKEGIYNNIQDKITVR